MPKAEISWKRDTEEGRLQVYAHHVGNRWLFYHRGKRYDAWDLVENPPLEDWLELLDAVRRLIPRRRVKPEEEQRIMASIRQHYPEAKIDE